MFLGKPFKGETQSSGFILATEPLKAAALTPKLQLYAKAAPVSHPTPQHTQGAEMEGEEVPKVTSPGVGPSHSVPALPCPET